MNFDSISQISSSKEKTDGYILKLKEILKSRDWKSLNEFLSHVSSNKVSPNVTKTVLQELCSLVRNQGFVPISDLPTIVEASLQILGPRSGVFEEVNRFLESAADVLQEAGDFQEAAKILSGLNVEQMKDYPQNCCNHYVHIAQLYLAIDKSEYAESYLAKAGQYIEGVTDANVKIKYNLCMAQINDIRRNYLKAARLYYDLSQRLVESEQLEMLKSSVISAILSKAGPERSRLLSALYKDDRCRRLDMFVSMEKMYLGRILRPSEVANIEKHLQKHQRVEGEEGLTSLTKAIIEHNLLSASGIYKNITFEQLGSLLGISPKKAEAFAAKMIQEKRMVAQIDQVDGFMHFAASADFKGTNVATTTAAAAVGDSSNSSSGGVEDDNNLKPVDKQILSLCQYVTDIVDEIILSEQQQRK